MTEIVDKNPTSSLFPERTPTDSEKSDSSMERDERDDEDGDDDFYTRLIRGKSIHS